MLFIMNGQKNFWPFLCFLVKYTWDNKKSIFDSVLYKFWTCMFNDFMDNQALISNILKIQPTVSFLVVVQYALGKLYLAKVEIYFTKRFNRV